MKKKVFTKKLVVNKETIAALNDDDMRSLLGGGKTEIGATCTTDAACCIDNKIIITLVC